MPFQRFVLCLFFSDILSLRHHDTNWIGISVRYDGWDNFPRVMLLALWWPGNRMSCLAPPPLAGGPIIMISFARITIPPRGSGRTYFISYSWWVIGVSEVGPLIETPYHCYLKHVCGTPFITKNIWSTMLNSLYQLSKHRCMGNVMKFFFPYLNGFLLYILSWISCPACPWEGYTPGKCV